MKRALIAGCAALAAAMVLPAGVEWHGASPPACAPAALCLAAEPAGKPAAAAEGADGFLPNDMCHVCHIDFAEEKLAVGHAKAKVWCRDCHGPSAQHMADEHIGATRPDRVYKTADVPAMCGKCHVSAEHPKLTAAKRAACLAAGKKAQEKLKEHRVEVAGVCTDCHGQHWLPPK
jgi:hypothetical protein